MKKLEIEVKVGIFVVIGAALLMVAILLLGGADALVRQQNRYQTHFQSVDGLIPGAKVGLNGIRVGLVESVAFDSATQNIKVTLKIERRFADYIRQDSKAEIVTQGVLGDKFISLRAGSPEQAVLEDGAEIPPAAGKDIKEFLTGGSQLIDSLNRIATSLETLLSSFNKDGRAEKIALGLSQTANNLSLLTDSLNKNSIQSLNSIMKKIDRGQGSLGALINDPGLYNDALNLVGGVNRNRIVRNLVRKTIEDNEKEQKK
jgi:phospholipid/cholesterol/gamma-HCH transport system substrate-binding protein